MPSQVIPQTLNLMCPSGATATVSFASLNIVVSTIEAGSSSAQITFPVSPQRYPARYHIGSSGSPRLTAKNASNVSVISRRWFPSDTQERQKSGLGGRRAVIRATVVHTIVDKLKLCNRFCFRAWICAGWLDRMSKEFDLRRI